MTQASPHFVRLEASSFCQLRCPSCPTTTGAIHPAIGSGFLRLDHFCRFLALNPSVNRVELSNYGEIFLNPQLPQILEQAAARKVAITVDNGANLNQAREEALEALVKYRVESLSCSLDGASPETYAKYRVRGNFNRVIGKIERINHYKQIYRTNAPHLIWQFVVFGHNEHEIPAARDMAAKLGMAFITKISWDSHFSPVRDRDFVRAKTGEAAITRGEYDAIHGHKYMSSICHQLWDSPQINWDGKLLGCCRNFWGDFGANAFVDTIEDCLGSEKMNYARGMLRGQKPPRDDIPCTTCELYMGMRERAQWIPRDNPSRPSHAAPKIPKSPGRSRAAMTLREVGARIWRSIGRADD